MRKSCFRLLDLEQMLIWQFFLWKSAIHHSIWLPFDAEVAEKNLKCYLVSHHHLIFHSLWFYFYISVMKLFHHTGFFLNVKFCFNVVPCTFRYDHSFKLMGKYALKNVTIIFFAINTMNLWLRCFKYLSTYLARCTSVFLFCQRQRLF